MTYGLRSSVMAVHVFAEASLADLVHEYWLIGEYGGECETAESREYYRAKLEAVAAIGRYRFGYEWNEALAE